MKAGSAVKHPSNSGIEMQSKKSVLTLVSYSREKGELQREVSWAYQQSCYAGGENFSLN